MAHFDAYLRYLDVLILSSAVLAGRGACRGGPYHKMFDYYQYK